MRRFYAYILMIFSILAVVLFNVQGQYEIFNYGLEFSNGTEITYRITPDNLENFKIDNVAEIFNKRLEAAGAKDYYVYLENDEYIVDESSSNPTYQVTVKLAGLENKQTNILRSLENYGKFWVTTDKNLRTSDGEDLVRGTASISYDGSKASISIETTDTFTNDIGSNLTVSDSSSDDEDTSSGDKIVIWKDYVDNQDSYEEAIKGETIEQIKMQNKIIAILDASCFVKGNNGAASKLVFDAVGYNSTGTSNETLNSESAHSVQRMLNDSLVDFKIERLHTSLIEPTYGNNSSLRIALSCIAICLIALIFLVVKYGLNGLAGATSIILSLFLSVVLYNTFRLSITPSFLISFACSLVLCLVITVSYLSRFKNELYKGRTPSKANKDSFSKTVSTALDASIFTLITSIILALISKNSIQNFSIFMVITVVIDLLVCLFVNRILFYFLANSSIGLKKKVAYRVKEDLIPDVSKDESQKYFSSFEEFDIKKKQKKSFIVTLLFALVSIASIATFTLAKNSTFAYSNEFNSYTMIQIVDKHGDEHFATNDDVVSFYKNTINQTPYEVEIIQIVDPNDETKNDNIYYINAKFNLEISKINDVKEVIEAKLTSEDYGLEFVTIEEENITNDSIKYFEVKPLATVKNYYNAILLVGITALCTIVYCFVRYRYTFILSSIATTGVTVLVTTGLLSLTRLPVSPSIGIALLGGILIATLFEFVLLVKNGQLIKENKAKNLTPAERVNFVTLALRRSMSSLLFIYITIVVSLLTMMFISPIQIYSLFLVAILSITISLLTIIFIFVPIYDFSENHLRIKFKKREKKEKKNVKKYKAKPKHASREVEEIIIPGIND